MFPPLGYVVFWGVFSSFFYGVGSCRGLVEVKAVRRQLGGGALSV